MKSISVENYVPNLKQLKAYGFIPSPELGMQVAKVPLKSGEFYAILKYSGSTISVSVMDNAFDEPYIPFDIPSSSGSTVERLREEVKSILETITAKCFTRNDHKSALCKHVFAKYGVVEDNPFPTLPEATTFRTKKGKWFALIMPIEASKLGLQRDEVIEVINVKSNRIPEVIDNKFVFPAYHMNKKYWITILMSAPLEHIKNLVDESYDAVTAPKKLKTQKK